MLLASTLGQVAHPFYELFAWILAKAYQIVPNYAIAIAILTLVVMIAVFPLTLKSTRSMMKMQLLAPEMKKLQAKFKASPGLTVAERQDLRQRQQEELMALYRENNVSPTGGCLPMLLQMPMLIILYGTIRGLIHTVKVKGVTVYEPLYISHSSKLYHAVIAAKGQLNAFGINLADSVRSSNLSLPGRIPFLVMILAACGLMYVSMTQMSRRNPQAAAANPQMQQMQKFMPVIFAIFYINVPAGVNVYFIISSLFRIAQQDLMYRRDPHIQASMTQLRARNAKVADQPKTEVAALPGGERPKGMFSRISGALMPPGGNGNSSTNGNGKGNGTADAPPPRVGAVAPRSSRASTAPKGKPTPTRQENRSQGKRPRRPR